MSARGTLETRLADMERKVEELTRRQSLPDVRPGHQRGRRFDKLLVKADVIIPTGATRACSIWNGPPGSESDTTVDIQATNLGDEIAALDWALAEHNGYGWYVTGLGSGGATYKMGALRVESTAFASGSAVTFETKASDGVVSASGATATIVSTGYYWLSGALVLTDTSGDAAHTATVTLHIVTGGTGGILVAKGTIGLGLATTVPLSCLIAADANNYQFQIQCAAPTHGGTAASGSSAFYPTFWLRKFAFGTFTDAPTS